MIANLPSVSGGDRVNVNAMLQRNKKKQQLRYPHNKFKEEKKFKKKKEKRKKSISKILSTPIKFFTPMRISAEDSMLRCGTQHSRVNLGFFIHVLVRGNKGRITKKYSGKTGTRIYPVE